MRFLAWLFQQTYVCMELDNKKIRFRTDRETAARLISQFQQSGYRVKVDRIR